MNDIKNMIQSCQTRHEARRDWASFDTCCLDISLYNRYQEDDYLRHTIQWINDRFSQCIVNFGDTLHRYNLQAEYDSAEAAHSRARRLGNEWLAKNGSILGDFAIPYEIIRNDDWLEKQSFTAVHSALWDFYKNRPEFTAIIEEDVKSFVCRQNDTDPVAAAAISRAYLIEETAVDIMYGKQGGVVHLYPGRRFGCYWYLAANADNIPHAIRGLENSAFKRLSPKRVCKAYGQDNRENRVFWPSSPLRAQAVS